MKTKKIKARQVGWMVVRYFPHYSEKWLEYLRSFDCVRNKAIGKYGRDDYRKLRRRALARCVAVYVEVSDEA